MSNEPWDNKSVFTKIFESLTVLISEDASSETKWAFSVAAIAAWVGGQTYAYSREQKGTEPALKVGPLVMVR